MEANLLKVLDKKYDMLIEHVHSMSIANGYWYSDHSFRSQFCIYSKLSVPTYFRYIKVLKESGLITEVDSRGLYKVNVDMLDKYRKFKQELV